MVVRRLSVTTHSTVYTRCPLCTRGWAELGTKQARKTGWFRALFLNLVCVCSSASLGTYDNFWGRFGCHNCGYGNDIR